MEQVLSKIRIADVIVLATPVYFFTMNAQMKTMIDRTLGGAQKAGLERVQKKWESSTAQVHGSSAIFKAALPCRRLIRWGKASVNIDHKKK